MLLTYSLRLGDCDLGEKRKWSKKIYIVADWGWILVFWGVSLVEKFMNINKLERKFVLVVWLGGVVKQEKDRHVITTERSLLFTKGFGLLKCEVSCCLCASQYL